MFKLRHVLYLLIAAVVGGCGVGLAQQTAVGSFAGSTDVGAVKPGSTVYLPEGKGGVPGADGGTYRVTGGGADMWGTADGLHLSWVRLASDRAVMTAEVQFPPEGVARLEKAVLIFRQSLDPGSAYADVAIHGDGHITAQYREVEGGKTADTTSTVHGVAGGWTRLRIERNGDAYTVSAGLGDGKMVASEPVTVTLHGPVYAGIGVCAHDAEGLATVSFRNVRIEGGTGVTAGR
jgi:TolB protein